MDKTWYFIMDKEFADYTFSSGTLRHVYTRGYKASHGYIKINFGG